MVKLKPDRLDDVFHALADSTRRSMVQRLSDRPTRIVDLAAPFKISLPDVSKHIRVLEDAGLVTRCKQGRESTIHLQADTISQAIDWLARHRKMWDASFDNLEAFLKETPKPNPQPKSKTKE